MTQIDLGTLQHRHGTKCKYATSEFGPPLPKTRLGHLKTYHNLAENSTPLSGVE